jgi:hypothetical protein
VKAPLSCPSFPNLQAQRWIVSFRISSLAFLRGLGVLARNLGARQGAKNAKKQESEIGGKIGLAGRETSAILLALFGEGAEMSMVFWSSHFRRIINPVRLDLPSSSACFRW